MKHIPLLVLVTLLSHHAALADAPAAGRSAPEDPSEGVTRAQADAILQELRSIRQLLEAQAGAPAPPPPRPDSRPASVKMAVSISAPGMVLGRKDAPVTLVEYLDFQCSFCRRHSDQTLPVLKQRYIDTGKLRYVTRDLPLEMHADAFPAARAGRCAAAQDKYWEMRRVLLANGNRLAAADLREHARSAGLDVARFEACTNGRAVDSAIRADVAEAGKLGISGTPTFILARTGEGEVDGTLILGAQPVAVFEQAIAELLGAPGPGN